MKVPVHTVCLIFKIKIFRCVPDPKEMFTDPVSCSKYKSFVAVSGLYLRSLCAQISFCILPFVHWILLSLPLFGRHLFTAVFVHTLLYSGRRKTEQLVVQLTPVKILCNQFGLRNCSAIKKYRYEVSCTVVNYTLVPVYF